MTHRVAISLTDEQKAQLEQIAEASEGTLVSAVEEAVTQFLHKREAYRLYVQEGLDAVARGDVCDWDEVKAELRAKYGDPEA